MRHCRTTPHDVSPGALRGLARPAHRVDGLELVVAGHQPRHAAGLGHSLLGPPLVQPLGEVIFQRLLLQNKVKLM